MPIAAQAVSFDLLKNYDACFILYDINQNKIIQEYNPNNRCNERISPDSTFKIPLSLMAFNQKLITENTAFKWRGEKGVLPEHERDQTPNTWIKYSVVWVSQRITQALGLATIKKYLKDFHYGNQDFSGDPGEHNGITHAWLSGSLKISAIEQLHFLTALVNHQLPLTKQAEINTEKNLYLGQLDNGANYYGKTGSGLHSEQVAPKHRDQRRDGWFVGYIKQRAQQYVFVSNLTDKRIPRLDDTAFGSQILKPITLRILNDCLYASNND
jgi:beta-lactamase class D